ncbi:MAG: hypothetical protein ACLFTU_03390 [Puniceicoccaceae bacterium]
MKTRPDSRTVSRIFRMAGLAAVLLAVPLAGGENPFIGIWKPDMDATLEKAKADPRFNEEDHAKMEKILPEIIGNLRLRITDETLTFRFGTQGEKTAPLTLESVSEDEVVLALAPEGIEPVQAMLASEGDEGMMIHIDGNNDMNFYVWERTDSMEAGDPDVAAIAAAAMEADGDAAAPATGKPPGAKPAGAARETTIRKNLRQIWSAARQYMLEEGVAAARYSDLEDEYFRPIEPVNGEDYTGIVVEARDKTISVTDRDGRKHSIEP